MSPLRTRFLFLSAWLLLWLLLVATATQDFMRNGGTAIWQPVLWESSSVLVGALLFLLQRHFSRQHDALLPQSWRWLRSQFIWLPINCLLFVPLTFALRHAVYALAGAEYQHQAWPQLFVYEALKVSLLFANCNLILFGFLSWQQLLIQRDQAHAANELLRQAQLQQLTQQIQPHFLFNALNTISSLMYVDVDKADATLMQLAQVLRTTLDVGARQQVDLATELRLLRGYASLMEQRFIDKVEINWQIDEACLQGMVPVMCLQPLLENVFKHVVEQTRHMTQIDISVRRDGANLLLCIADDQGRLRAIDEAAQQGIGLANVRARLHNLYGEQAQLRLTQLSPSGVASEIILPWNDHAHLDRR